VSYGSLPEAECLQAIERLGQGLALLADKAKAKAGAAGDA
jgi:hypothetical protein